MTMITTSICHIESNQSVKQTVQLTSISGDKSISHRAIILGSLSSSRVICLNELYKSLTILTDVNLISLFILILYIHIYKNNKTPKIIQ